LIAKVHDNKQAAYINNSSGSSCSRLVISNLDIQTCHIATKNIPTTLWEKAIHFLTLGDYRWTTISYKESEGAETKEVLVNKNSLIKRLHNAGVNENQITQAVSNSANFLSTFIARTIPEVKISADLTKVRHLNLEERNCILDYWKSYGTRLVQEAQLENTCIRIQPKNSGLARTLIITPEGKLFIILNKKTDTRVGKGCYKEVKFCFELTEGKFATYTSFTDKKEYENEIRHLEKFKGTPNVLQLLAKDKYTSKKGVEKFGLITEYCNFGDMSHLDFAKFPSDKKIKFLQDLVRALQEIHSKGSIHRDIKRLNIFIKTVKEEFIPIIADFGVANDKTETKRRRKMYSTPLYMHPKVALNNLHRDKDSNYMVDETVDIWALGVVFYQIMSDEKSGLPWADKGPTQVYKNLAKYANGQEVFPKPNDEKSFSYLVWKMLQADPSKQFTLEEVMQFLEKNPNCFDSSSR
ncbi:MAG: protein kinase, partial [Chlamydiae bacterium]|nr:protein kinase [Chlamydiota bacterium]